MNIRITLGRAFNVNEQVLLRTPDRLAEMDPDLFFDAMQRVGHPTDPHADHLEADMERISRMAPDGLTRITLKFFRRRMERDQLPSMSVGDTIEFLSDAGEPIVAYTCDRFGWSAGKELSNVE